eukprot:6849975-Prymnesium_polylepis.1
MKVPNRAHPHNAQRICTVRDKSRIGHPHNAQRICTVRDRRDGIMRHSSVSSSIANVVGASSRDPPSAARRRPRRVYTHTPAETTLTMLHHARARVRRTLTAPTHENGPCCADLQPLPKRRAATAFDTCKNRQPNSARPLDSTPSRTTFSDRQQPK